MDADRFFNKEVWDDSTRPLITGTVSGILPLKKLNDLEDEGDRASGTRMSEA